MSLVERIKNLFRDPRIVWDKDGNPRALRGGVYDYSEEEYEEIVAVFERHWKETDG